MNTNNWIGKKIDTNPQLQEFIEKSLSYLYNLCEEDGVLEDLADEMDYNVDEVIWMFNQMNV